MAFKPFLAYEASAGSGKTFNLVVRYLSLLFMGEDPKEILALTFTNKAANEMLERITLTLERLEERGELGAIASLCDATPEAILIERDAVLRRFLRSDIQISTIDTFFGTILRKFALNAGLMPTFSTAQAHHDIKLAERFLNEADVAGLTTSLIRLSLLSSKRVTSLFELLETLYGKHKEFDLYRYEGNELEDTASVIASILENAASLKALLIPKPLSDPSRKTLEFDGIESLLNCSWVFRPTMEYWHFKKHFEPRMDEYLHAMQKGIAHYFKARETEFFKELFRLLRIYLKCRKDMAVHNNELTFDDITLNVHTLLREQLESEFLYFRLDRRIKHLLLDEFQDTSMLQFDILRPLIEEIRSGEGVSAGGSFFFVGDVKQSIYRFRGGVSALFHKVADWFDVHVEPLKVNYRSHNAIVGFINTAFEGKIEGYIPQESPDHLAGGYVRVIESDEILESLGHYIGELSDKGIPGEKIAVLSVTNKDGGVIEEYLQTLGYPVVTETTARLVSQRSVRTLIEYLRYGYFKHAIYRLNCASIAGVKYEEVDLFDVTKPIESVIAFMRRFGLCDKSALLFVESLYRYRDLEEIVFEIDRLEAAAPQSDQKGIRIMTVHKSKGLEFDHVIVMDRLGKAKANTDPIVFEYDGVHLEKLHYRIKNRENVDADYAKGVAYEEYASNEDRLNALYVALTRAVDSLCVIAKAKDSWFEPLGLSVMETGEIPLSEHSEHQVIEAESPLFEGLRFGLQEENTASEQEETYNFQAVQFGLATHYALEMMGSFEPDSLGSAMEAVRNRYGAVLGDGSIGEIGRRLELLLQDDLFKTLSTGRCYKEQPFAYKGAMHVVDLLIAHEERWIIVDYKTGRDDEEKYLRQMERYGSVVAQTLGVRVEGYLCYLLSEGIEWRKCL